MCPLDFASQLDEGQAPSIGMRGVEREAIVPIRVEGHHSHCSAIILLRRSLGSQPYHPSVVLSLFLLPYNILKTEEPSGT